jgi:hypothetical protein
MIVHPVELGSETLTLLAPVFSHGATVAQGVATRLLGDMVAKRLAHAGHEDAWEEFKHDPTNRAPTERFLRQILNEDPEFQAQLEGALVAAMQENSHNSEQHGNINITDSGQAQIGNRGDTIKGDRVATRGGTYNERARITNKTTNKTPGGSVVALAVVAFVVIVGLLFIGGRALLHLLESGNLSANSTCQDFLNASPEAQQEIVQSLAAQYHKPDYVTPLGEPEVPYYCAANPSVTLGQFFANAQP